MTDIRAKFEEIWPVPEGVEFCDVFGGYWHESTQDKLSVRFREYDIRLDTFTRCQELIGAERDQLQAEIERLKGLQPSFPPRPPEGYGLPRFGLRWNGPSNPLAVSMDDGYWTPWHLADELRKDAERFRHLMFNHVDWARNGKDDDAVMLEFGPYPSHKLRETLDADMAKIIGDSQETISHA